MFLFGLTMAAKRRKKREFRERKRGENREREERDIAGEKRKKK